MARFRFRGRRRPAGGSLSHLAHRWVVWRRPDDADQLLDGPGRTALHLQVLAVDVVPKTTRWWSPPRFPLVKWQLQASTECRAAMKGRRAVGPGRLTGSGRRRWRSWSLVRRGWAETGIRGSAGRARSVAPASRCRRVRELIGVGRGAGESGGQIVADAADRVACAARDDAQDRQGSPPAGRSRDQVPSSPRMVISSGGSVMIAVLPIVVVAARADRSSPAAVPARVTPAPAGDNVLGHRTGISVTGLPS